MFHFLYEIVNIFKKEKVNQLARMVTAMRLLDIALEYNELDEFLIGFPGYELGGKDGNGGYVQDTSLVMQAIYKKYEIDPSISEKFYEAIAGHINRTKSGKTLMEMLRVINAQLRHEKEKTAPFSIDCAALLQLARENIVRNRDLYLKPLADLGGDVRMTQFALYDENLYRNYGYRIL